MRGINTIIRKITESAVRQLNNQSIFFLPKKLSANKDKAGRLGFTAIS